MTNILTSLLPRKRLQWQDLRTKKGMFLEHGSSICNITEQKKEPSSIKMLHVQQLIWNLVLTSCFFHHKLGMLLPFSLRSNKL